MLDNRIHTFLKLCEVMNYRKTAEILKMTQPAVTQHIHFLEQEYDCKLFDYNARVLSKTPKCLQLEQYARAMVHNDIVLSHKMAEKPIRKVAIGATKTIGDYVMHNIVLNLLKYENVQLEVIIESTAQLVAKLNDFELDILLVEGYFDKNTYDYMPIKIEKLYGVCSKEHKFAGREIELETLFDEHVILREKGSGTRAVFEQFLSQHSFSTKSFRRKSIISSFGLIEKAVMANLGVSFVYESVAKHNKNLAIFTIKGVNIENAFNYVYLKGTDLHEILELLQAE